MCHHINFFVQTPFYRSVIPNCQFRSKTSRLKTFTANQLDEIKDPSGLFYILPFQKVRPRRYSLSRARGDGNKKKSDPKRSSNVKHTKKII